MGKGYAKKPYRRAKTHWQKVINFAEGTLNVIDEGPSLSIRSLITSSPSTTVPPASTTVTVSGFKVAIDFISGTGNWNKGAAYVVYVPEGINDPGLNIVTMHPEWVLGWAPLGYIVSNNPAVIYGKTRRNLKSGDSIWLFVTASNAGSTGVAYWSATYEYFLKSN